MILVYCKPRLYKYLPLNMLVISSTVHFKKNLKNIFRAYDYETQEATLEHMVKYLWNILGLCKLLLKLMFIEKIHLSQKKSLESWNVSP